MGEIADMILDGLLDEETGEYIGYRNLKRYGEEAPGFPVTYRNHRKPRYTAQKKEPCPVCGKLVATGGPPLAMHMKAKHGETHE